VLFNSVPYLIFFPIVFLCYWFVFNKSIRVQNLFLICVSYFFYGWWDWRFLSLIILSSFLDYYTGAKIESSSGETQKKLFLWLSIGFNLGMLCLFKYYNFFIDSLEGALAGIGYEFSNRLTIQVILPVGISFYTFQTMSYSIDVYLEKIKANKDIIAFFAYVSFFPQLVAGPIETAPRFLPQFSKKRVFNYANSVDGCRQILWGFFKKVAIADVIAVYVDQIFSNYETLSAGVLLLGAVLFAVQIYCDFSGYSDIAIGTARLFSFNLTDNFRTPYFSLSIIDYWRRWHISLTNYIKEYVYLPLSFAFRRFKLFVFLSVLFAFGITGLWHGANLTFVFFGLWHGVMVTLEYVSQGVRGKIVKYIPKSLALSFAWVFTAFVWLVGSIIFRSDSLNSSIIYLKRMFSPGLLSESINTQLVNIDIDIFTNVLSMFVVPTIVVMFAIEWVNRAHKHGLAIMFKNSVLRNFSYISLALVCIKFFFSEEVFIYFQF